MAGIQIQPLSKGFNARVTPCRVAESCSRVSALLLVAASVSQDPRRKVLSLQSHTHWSCIRDNPQCTEDPSALCAPSCTALLWALGIYSCDE